MPPKLLTRSSSTPQTTSPACYNKATCGLSCNQRKPSTTADTNTSNVSNATRKARSEGSGRSPRPSSSSYHYGQPAVTRTSPPWEPKGRSAHTLSCTKYAVAGAIVGVAETAFLQHPTRDNPNQYHLYQGTQRSHPITQDDIPSWWVLLAIVVREADTQGGPCHHLCKKVPQSNIRQGKRGPLPASNTAKRQVKKTITKSRPHTAASRTSSCKGYEKCRP